MRAPNGLTIASKQSEEVEEHHRLVCELRVISMCIAQALAEDDFETAYSYIETRLAPIAQRAEMRSSYRRDSTTGQTALKPLERNDEWSWKVALEAGKYRRNAQSIPPSHIGNASANLDIRHVEQRMDCLQLALRMAPNESLNQILNRKYSPVSPLRPSKLTLSTQFTAGVKKSWKQ